MSFLSKLGFSSRKKERHEQLKNGDRILVEFGRDRVPIYINMFEIPRAAKTLVDVMARSSLKRRVKLPDVAKFMYDDYIAWTDTVEATANRKSWGHIILLSYTTKVLQDGPSHDKALLTMMTKGEALGYQKNLMFTTGDWNMLHIHVKAGDTRDEGMRQVLQRLFNRSVGLWELLNIPAQDLLDMGVDREKLCDSANSLSKGSVTAVSKNDSVVELSTQAGEDVHVAGQNSCTVASEADETEVATAEITISVKEDDDQDLEILSLENLDLYDEKADTDTGKEKVSIATGVPLQQETTEAEMKTALEKLPSNLGASKWAKGATTHDVVSTDPIIEDPPASQEAERTAAFTPTKQLPRLPSGLQLPVYTRNIYTESPDNQNSDYASGFSPRHEIPRSAPTSPKASAPHGEGTAIPTKNHPVIQGQHLEDKERKIANLKYSKSVLNTQRAKQSIWPGDAPRDSGMSSGMSTSSLRQPKGPPVAGDWKEVQKAFAGYRPQFPQNFAVGAVPRAEGRPKKRMTYSFEKGVHSVDCD